ncbi:MAG: M48 family metalloprotease [Bacteroidales bacterium]|nr:M48 family metalloprotease [Bacteroidales bacterium]
MRKIWRILALVTMLAMASVSGQAQWSKLYKMYKAASGAYKAYKAYNLTDKELAEYARESMKVMDAQNKVCSTSNAYAKRLQKITKGLTSINGTKLNFKVYADNETANAFACPDGSVRVYSRLMDIMTDEEILGVISHEIGHVACKHSLKEYKAALYASAARDGLSMGDGTIAEIAQSSLGELAEGLVNAKYSRTQESEADDFGYKFLKSHGKNPWYIAMSLQKLLDSQKGGTSNKYARALETMFSTHPDLQKRVEKLSARAKKDGFKKP